MKVDGKSNELRVLNWNLEWAKPGSPRGNAIQRIIDECAPDLACLTEAYVGFWGEDGYWAEAAADYGYKIIAGRRKVMIWSRNSWDQTDDIGEENIPSGRFVTGITSTSIGLVRVIGICVPWSHAHVTSGRRDRRAWEDHEAYLVGLRNILSVYGHGMPTLVLGDWNQRMPSRTAPTRVRELLDECLSGRFSVWTKGRLPALGHDTVDHIAGNAGLEFCEVSGIPRLQNGKRLSDHDAIVTRCRPASVDEQFASPGKTNFLQGFAGR